MTGDNKYNIWEDPDPWTNEHKYETFGNTDEDMRPDRDEFDDEDNRTADDFRYKP